MLFVVNELDFRQRRSIRPRYHNWFVPSRLAGLKKKEMRSHPNC